MLEASKRPSSRALSAALGEMMATARRQPALAQRTSRHAQWAQAESFPSTLRATFRRGRRVQFAAFCFVLATMGR